MLKVYDNPQDVKRAAWAFSDIIGRMLLNDYDLVDTVVFDLLTVDNNNLFAYQKIMQHLETAMSFGRTRGDRLGEYEMPRLDLNQKHINKLVKDFVTIKGDSQDARLSRSRILNVIGKALKTAQELTLSSDQITEMSGIVSSASDKRSLDDVCYLVKSRSGESESTQNTGGLDLGAASKQQKTIDDGGVRLSAGDALSFLKKPDFAGLALMVEAVRLR